MDTALLGLKYEFISYLADHDIMMFSDFSDMEVDMSNGEIVIVMLRDFLPDCIIHWAKKNGFRRPFQADNGKVYLRR